MRQKIVVIPLGNWLLDFNNLTLHLRLADSEGEGGSSISDSFSQSCLEPFLG